MANDTVSYAFDLMLNSHAVNSVNSRTGDVMIGIADTAGLQIMFDNAKFNSNLNGSLSVDQSGYFRANERRQHGKKKFV